jgi:hypothetical protein
MGWKLGLCGVLAFTTIGYIPVSKTFYSDHVYVKYVPRIMFVDDKDKQEEYLKLIENSRKDKYARQLYGRNYHRWLWRKPLCTVVGSQVYDNFQQTSSESENDSK